MIRPTPTETATRRRTLLGILAAEPGLTRPELAARTALTEAQVQHDLKRLRARSFRCLATVTVTRDHGYRLAVASVERFGGAL